ncbi:MAG: hypothetical protein ACRCUQ_02925 [Alphaproteobacteria bacterium]
MIPSTERHLLTKLSSRGGKDGKAEGRKEEKLKLAKKFLSTGMLVEDVCELTGLLRDERVCKGADKRACYNP